MVDELRLQFADAPLVFRSNRTLREEVMRLFDQTFAITRILQGMSLLVAVTGVTLTLLVLAREQVSELALYRALGARRRQIFGVFVGKGAAIGLTATLLGSAAGVGLAAILIYVINRDYFGWTIQPFWEWAPILRTAVTILIAATVASLYPALRATETSAGELNRDDL